MVSFRDWVQAFREVGVSASRPVMVHASLSAVGEVRGGAETVVGALLSVCKGLMAPTFTYQTMIIPEVGVPENALRYGSGRDLNRMAEVFAPDMPADAMMGVVPETIRKHAQAKRSDHPILSFAGINVERALAAQSIADPLGPVRVMAEDDALVLLIGVDHTVNTSIHLAEKLAGRKTFVRYALTRDGVKECPGFPGCSDGFEVAAPFLSAITHTARVGNATLRALPISVMVMTLTGLMKEQPTALLCHKTTCERCEATRAAIQAHLLKSSVTDS